MATQQAAMIAFLALVLAGIGQNALAHEAAEGIVKTRMEAMEKLGKSMKDLAAMIRGKTTYDAELARQHARTIQSHSGNDLLQLFPEGSMDKPTEAIPVIWEKWDRFALLANQLGDYAEALEMAAENPPMTKGGTMMTRPSGQMPDPVALADMPPDAAFMHVAQTCSACHKSFRQKK